MALYRCLVTLNMTSGLNEDAATNTFYFDADDDGVLNDIHVFVKDFYASQMERFSNLIDRANCTTEWYRMSDPTPRSPVATFTMTGLPTSTSAGPPEVALVLSYQGEKISGLPQARRRGRVYLGPLAAMTDSRPPSGLINFAENAGQALLDASNAATDWTWAQYSPTNGSGINVTNGWVDNEYDIQRRRGRKATARQTFS